MTFWTSSFLWVGRGSRWVGWWGRRLKVGGREVCSLSRTCLLQKALCVMRRNCPPRMVLSSSLLLRRSMCSPRSPRSVPLSLVI